MNNKCQDLSFEKKVGERLRRIANFLLLNASFIDNPGLLNGKMGIAVFFFHYFRYTNSKIFEDYAGSLIDEIYEEINTNTPVTFADGLTGIGWGIEYLVHNKFVEADTDEALAEMDSVIYKQRLNSPVLLNTGDDLFGYGFYYISRLLGHETGPEDLNTLINKHNLIFLLDECERILIHKRYLDFNILSLSIRTINSLLWFLLKMQMLELFPVKVNKLLEYLPDYLAFRTKENETPADLYILHCLSKSVFESVSDNKIRLLYNSLIDNNKSNLNSIRDDHCFIEYLVYINQQNLIYQPYVSSEYLNNELFERAFSTIDNEKNWNERLDDINKYNLGLNGFAGLGLYILNAANSINLRARQSGKVKQYLKS